MIFVDLSRLAMEWLKVGKEVVGWWVSKFCFTDTLAFKAFIEIVLVFLLILDMLQWLCSLYGVQLFFSSSTLTCNCSM
jgi:hypothetical protein